MISGSLYVIVNWAGMLALARGPGVGVIGVECVDNCCVGGWATWIGASCTDSGCGIFFVFGTDRDDATASKIVARFLSDKSWSELASVVDNG